MGENKIDIQMKTDCTSEELAATKWIDAALQEAIELEQLCRVEVSVVLVDNDTMHTMNHEYRGVDRPTDVLSFPLWENMDEWKASQLDLVPLGDIVISLSRARDQAKEYGHSLQRELAFLATHGFLHLIGYLHDTEEEEQRMTQRQEQILGKIGLKR